MFQRLELNDDLWTCLAKKENISIVVPVQLLHNFNNFLEELNFPPFDIQNWVLEAMDENHLKSMFIFNLSMIQLFIF